MSTPRLGAALPLVASFGHAPGSDHADRPSPGGPNGFATRAIEDLAVLAENGVDAVRVPVDWTRVVPEEGVVHGGTLEWYARLLEAAATAGVAVWLSLFEGISPAWFDDAGGWNDERTVGRWWPRYVEAVADALGDGVAGWCPIDRPTRFARRGWLGGGAPPERDDPRVHAEVLRTLAIAWRDAWRVLRGGPPVATLLELEVVRAADQTVPAAQAARQRDATLWTLWLRALREGVVEVPGLAALEVPGLEGALDLLGAVVIVPERPDDLAAIGQRVQEQGPDRPLHLTLVPPPGLGRLEVARRAEAVAPQVAQLGATTLARLWWSPGIDPAGQPEDRRTGFLDEDRQPGPVTEAVQGLVAEA